MVMSKSTTSLWETYAYPLLFVIVKSSVLHQNISLLPVLDLLALHITEREDQPTDVMMTAPPRLRTFFLTVPCFRPPSIPEGVRRTQRVASENYRMTQRQPNLHSESKKQTARYGMHFQYVQHFGDCRFGSQFSQTAITS